ncbi:MAG TPA: response regulator [bacterium]|nr:response regulator [bacterium]
MTTKTVLIYEYDNKHAKSLRKAFEQFDLTVRTARSEDDMQEFLGTGAIDLFVIRAENPSISGLLLCKKIREISEYRSTPILVLSSEATEQTFEKHRALDFAADHYMSLPQDAESILAAAHMLMPFLDGAEEAVEEVPAAAPVADGQAAMLQEEVKKLRSELQRRDAELKEASSQEAALKKLREENERLAAEAGELKEAIAQKAAQAKELEKAVSQGADLAAEFDKAAGQITALQTEVKRLEVELSAEREKSQAMNEDKTEVSRSLEQLKAQLKEESDRAMKGASVEAEELKKKYDEAKDELGDLRIVNKEMKDKVKASEKDMEKMKAEHEAFTAEKDALLKKAKEAEEAVVEQARTLKEEFEQKEKSAQAESKRLLDELQASYEEKLKPISDELKVKSEKLELLQAEKESIEIDLATSRYKATQAEKQCGESKTRLEAAEKELNELRETVLQFSSLSDDRDAALRDKEAALAEAAALTARIEALEAEKGAVEKKAAELAAEVDRIAELEKTIAAKDADIAAAKEEATRLAEIIESVRKAVS